MPDVPDRRRNCPITCFRRLTAAFAILTTCALGASAEDEAYPLPAGAELATGERSVPFEAMVRMVAFWVAAELDLPLPEVMPVVVFTSPRSMVELRYGMAANERLSVTALYHARTSRIFLADDWTGATPKEVSILVHEMVHHVEAQAGVRHPCPGLRERNAYRLQQEWLMENGSDLNRAFGMNPMQVARNSSC